MPWTAGAACCRYTAANVCQPVHCSQFAQPGKPQPWPYPPLRHHQPRTPANGLQVAGDQPDRHVLPRRQRLQQRQHTREQLKPLAGQLMQGRQGGGAGMGQGS